MIVLSLEQLYFYIYIWIEANLCTYVSFRSVNSWFFVYFVTYSFFLQLYFEPVINHMTKLVTAFFVYFRCLDSRILSSIWTSVNIFFLPNYSKNCSSLFCFINLLPNKPWFLRVCSTSLLKTLREKEKLLVTSNFSFSHSAFNPFG